MLVAIASYSVMYIILVIYVLISLGFGLIVYHSNSWHAGLPVWYRAMMGLLMALGWPLALLYVLGRDLYRLWNRGA